MPPAGFDFIAPVIIAFRDEIVPLKAEVLEQRTATQRDVRSSDMFMIVRSSFMNFVIMNGIILKRLLDSCLDQY